MALTLFLLDDADRANLYKTKVEDEYILILREQLIIK